MKSEFEARQNDVEKFKVSVSDAPGTWEGVHIDMGYWIFTKNTGFNPEIDIYLTPEQTIELYEKLGQYILDRNLKKTEEIA